jgi:hypothetical protein
VVLGQGPWCATCRGNACVGGVPLGVCSKRHSRGRINCNHPWPMSDTSDRGTSDDDKSRFIKPKAVRGSKVSIMPWLLTDDFKYQLHMQKLVLAQLCVVSGVALGIANSPSATEVVTGLVSSPALVLVMLFCTGTLVVMVLRRWVRTTVGATLKGPRKAGKDDDSDNGGGGGGGAGASTGNSTDSQCYPQPHVSELGSPDSRTGGGGADGTEVAFDTEQDRGGGPVFEDDSADPDDAAGRSPSPGPGIMSMSMSTLSTSMVSMSATGPRSRLYGGGGGGSVRRHVDGGTEDTVRRRGVGINSATRTGNKARQHNGPYGQGPRARSGVGMGVNLGVGGMSGESAGGGGGAGAGAGAGAGTSVSVIVDTGTGAAASTSGGGGPGFEGPTEDDIETGSGGRSGKPRPGVGAGVGAGTSTSTGTGGSVGAGVSTHADTSLRVCCECWPAFCTPAPETVLVWVWTGTLALTAAVAVGFEHKWFVVVGSVAATVGQTMYLVLFWVAHGISAREVKVRVGTKNTSFNAHSPEGKARVAPLAKPPTVAMSLLAFVVVVGVFMAVMALVVALLVRHEVLDDAHVAMAVLSMTATMALAIVDTRLVNALNKHHQQANVPVLRHLALLGIETMGRAFVRMDTT